MHILISFLISSVICWLRVELAPRISIHGVLVEKTEEYLAVIDKVEEKIEKTKQMNFCLEYWNLKAQFLFEYGILWRSPTQLNPGVMFD